MLPENRSAKMRKVKKELKYISWGENKMKKLIILALVVCASTPAFASPTIEFSPNPGTAGNWFYDGAGTLSFDQDIAVDKGLGSNTDALVGSLVYIPTLAVSGIPSGPYTVTPIGSSTISIRSADKSTTYLLGTLAAGDLVPIGTIAGGYTSFKADITNVAVTAAGQALGSAALSTIMYAKSLDFELSLQGGSGTKYLTFAKMMSGGYAGGNGFSGAMTVPEPATIALLGLGSLLLLKKRRS